MIEKMGYFFGRLVRSEDGLIGLKNGLEKFFNELKEFRDFEFSAEFVNGKLVTRSRCPIHKYLKIWCDCCCLNFIKGFAKAGVSGCYQRILHPWVSSDSGIHLLDPVHRAPSHGISQYT